MVNWKGSNLCSEEAWLHGAMPPLPPSPLLVRCQALWDLVDAARLSCNGVSQGGHSAAAAAQNVHSRYLRDALLATSQLAQREFRAGLGRNVRLLDGAGVLWDYKVDFLRPAAFGSVVAIACSGLAADGSRVLLFLGHDELIPCPDTGPDFYGSAEVIHLNAVAARLRTKSATP